MREVNEKLDRLLHDAEHAESGRYFAHMLGHVAPAIELAAKRDRLLAEARKLHADNPGSEWPECEYAAW